MTACTDASNWAHVVMMSGKYSLVESTASVSPGMEEPGVYGCGSSDGN